MKKLLIGIGLFSLSAMAASPAFKEEVLSAQFETGTFKQITESVTKEFFGPLGPGPGLNPTKGVITYSTCKPVQEVLHSGVPMELHLKAPTSAGSPKWQGEWSYDLTSYEGKNLTLSVSGEHDPLTEKLELTFELLSDKEELVTYASVEFYSLPLSAKQVIGLPSFTISTKGGSAVVPPYVPPYPNPSNGRNDSLRTEIDICNTMDSSPFVSFGNGNFIPDPDPNH